MEYTLKYEVPRRVTHTKFMKLISSGFLMMPGIVLGQNKVISKCLHNHSVKNLSEKGDFWGCQPLEVPMVWAELAHMSKLIGLFSFINYIRCVNEIKYK